MQEEHKHTHIGLINTNAKALCLTHGIQPITEFLSTFEMVTNRWGFKSFKPNGLLTLACTCERAEDITSDKDKLIYFDLQTVESEEPTDALEISIESGHPWQELRT